MEKALSASHSTDSTTSPPTQAPSRVVPAAIATGALCVLAFGWLLVHRAESGVNKVPLSATPKPVTAVVARETRYRETHTYIGTLRPWVEANVGPQFVSAYVDTVLVRPGASVKRNEVLATLDCRNANASSMGVAAEARAIDARQKAIADESARLNSLLDGGFVSPNEAEQKEAQSASEQAQLASQRAKLTAMGLAVNDCILRAPFDGEVSVRWLDPGVFVHPGTPIVTLVDRNTVRMTFEVPEIDFGAVAQQTPVSLDLLATGKKVIGAIARRSPAADVDTRTVHVEVDLDNTNRDIPVNTTGEVSIQVGQPVPAAEVPLVAASITGSKAALFVIDGDIAHQRTFQILGEQGSHLYLETTLKPGSRVVTEGRALLADGDRVAPKAADAAISSSQPSPPEVRQPEVAP
ncbi:MAG: efflux RND transporter periplasmic adaptor subunit [Polyangiaceae bacterium]|jgi:RND family efflux transporter MFP subunit